MTEETPREVTVTFAGRCRGNPGPGSWKATVEEPRTGKRRVENGTDQDTTSNRMELTAALKGIGQVRPGANLTMVGNSQYVVRGMGEWVAGWQARGWRTNDGKRLENADLWGALVAAVKRHRRVTWRTG